MCQKVQVCSVIPPHVLRNVARHAVDGALRASARATLDHTQTVAAAGRGSRLSAPAARRRSGATSTRRSTPGSSRGSWRAGRGRPAGASECQ